MHTNHYFAITKVFGVHVTTRLISTLHSNMCVFRKSRYDFKRLQAKKTFTWGGNEIFSFSNHIIFTIKFWTQVTEAMNSFKLVWSNFYECRLYLHSPLLFRIYLFLLSINVKCISVAAFSSVVKASFNIAWERPIISMHLHMWVSHWVIQDISSHIKFASLTTLCSATSKSKHVSASSWRMPVLSLIGWHGILWNLCSILYFSSCLLLS